MLLSLVRDSRLSTLAFSDVHHDFSNVDPCQVRPTRRRTCRRIESVFELMILACQTLVVFPCSRFSPSLPPAFSDFTILALNARYAMRDITLAKERSKSPDLVRVLNLQGD